MDDLDSLKSDPSVLQVYASRIKLTKNGDKYAGLCPFHGEKSPSFTVHKDLRYHCYGCGASGNIFQLVQQTDGIDFAAAVEKVKQEIGRSDWGRVKQTAERAFKPVSEAPKNYKTLPLSDWSRYQNNLQGDKAALDYLLRERGITAETALKLRFGYVQNIGKIAGEAGANIADKGWLAFPSIEGGKVVGIKYRSLVRKKPGGFARQPGMSSCMFNLETLDLFESVFVVEGEYDCAILEQHGLRAVSLANSTTKPTPHEKDLLMSGASCVILAGDTDAAGSGAMQKLWKELQGKTYLLQWPAGMKDANQTFLEHCGRDSEKFVRLMDELSTKAKSQPMPDIYSIQEVMQNGEDRSLSEREDRTRFPWPSVDKMAILLPGSVLGVMATSTGQGKTCWTLQESLYGARKYNEVVINWQCELSPSEISNMVAAQVLRKNRNFLSKDDLKLAADQLRGVQYYIGNNPSSLGIMDVLDIMEAAIRRLGATVAILDNIHFYCSGVDDDVRVLASAMTRIKQMASQYGVKWQVVFQPRKATAQTKGRKTHVSDVKGSATAGDTCDSVVAIHRELNKEEGKTDIYEEKTLVEMLKTRSKGIGKSSAFLHFYGEFAAFEEIDSNYGEPE